MKSLRPGILLLDLLISIALSSIIMFAVMQSYRNVQRYLKKTQSRMNVSKKACLLFNQLERDLNCATLGPFGMSNTTTVTDAQATTSTQAKNFIAFAATTYEGVALSIKKEKYELFKYLSFVTTNALSIKEEEHVRWVRVVYELTKDKEKSSRTQTFYTLLRHETEDLSNMWAAPPQEAGSFKPIGKQIENSKNMPVRTYVVASDIKECVFSYYFPKEEGGASSNQKEEEQFIKVISTASMKEKPSTLPRFVQTTITFRDQVLEEDRAYECMLPIITYLLQAGEKKASMKATPVQGETKETKKEEGQKTPSKDLVKKEETDKAALSEVKA